MKKFLSVISILVLSMLLVACNLNIEDKRSGEQVTIKHEVSVFEKMGQDGLPVYKKEIREEKFYTNPKSVVVFSLGIADVFNYLGLESLGIKTFGLPKGGQPLPESLKVFNDKKYHDVGTLKIPNENILDLLNPELIILDGRTSHLYEEYKIKYPHSDIIDLSITTYSLKTQTENYNKLSQIFTKIENRLDDVLIDFKNSFEEISTYAKKYRASFIQVTGTEIGVGIGKTGRYGLLFNEFGFLEADPNGNIFTESSHGATGVDAIEYIPKVNPEVIFIMDRNIIVSNEPSELEFLKDLKNSSVPAFKSKYIFYLDPYAWYTITGGVQSTYQTIEDINQFISKIK